MTIDEASPLALFCCFAVLALAIASFIVLMTVRSRAEKAGQGAVTFRERRPAFLLALATLPFIVYVVIEALSKR